MGHPDTEEHHMCYFPWYLTPPCRRHLRENKKENQNFHPGESSTMEVKGKRGQLCPSPPLCNPPLGSQLISEPYKVTKSALIIANFEIRIISQSGFSQIP